MALIIDKEIKKLVDQGCIKNIKSTGWEKKEDPIQASSIDLHIGNIYIPGKVNNGGKLLSKSEAYLKQGHTAVVETKEVLELPYNYSAIGFPASSKVSFKGLLMTNPGHVDPGYSGTLRFTVINMAEESFKLASNEPIATLLIFRLENAPQHDWLSRRGGKLPSSEESQKYIKENVDRLSVDFMNIDKRAESAVSKAQWRAAIISSVIAILGVAIAALIPAIVNSLSGVGEIEGRVKILENNQNIANIETRLQQIEESLSRIGPGKK